MQLCQLRPDSLRAGAFSRSLILAAHHLHRGVAASPSASSKRGPHPTRRTRRAIPRQAARPVQACQTRPPEAGRCHRELLADQWQQQRHPFRPIFRGPARCTGSNTSWPKPSGRRAESLSVTYHSHRLLAPRLRRRCR